MKNLKIHLILVSLLFGTVLTFQNCGKVQFSSDQGALVAKNGDPVLPEEIPTGDGDDPVIIEDEPVLEDPDDAALIHICILDGPGQSRHIGYDQALTNDGNTPQAVCMSKNACLNIAAAAFDVVSAEVRGFCPDKNPHVVAMTDEEVSAGVETLLNP